MWEKGHQASISSLGCVTNSKRKEATYLATEMNEWELKLRSEVHLARLVLLRPCLYTPLYRKGSVKAGAQIQGNECSSGEPPPAYDLSLKPT